MKIMPIRNALGVTGKVAVALLAIFLAQTACQAEGAPPLEVGTSMETVRTVFSLLFRIVGKLWAEPS